jgi:16S rRNA processing protein RimM
MTPPVSQPPNNAPGSQGGEAPAFLAVGRLRKPHGVRGEITMEVMTDFPERLQKGLTLFVGPDHTPKIIRSIRSHDKLMLVAFEEHHTPEDVGEMRNQFAYVSSADRPPLEEGEYYHHELIGLTVVDEDGQLLGKIVEILETGASDVYIVRSDAGPEILLPDIPDVVLDINLAEGLMRVHILPGLLNEE